MELLEYLKRQKLLVLLLIGITAVFAAVFSLYDLPLEAIGYAAAPVFGTGRPAYFFSASGVFAPATGSCCS